MPLPGEPDACFNLDPWMLGLLCLVCACHFMRAPDGRTRLYAAAGWLVTAAALVSPLCSLSAALFCAGMGQQLILLLVAAVPGSRHRHMDQRGGLPADVLVLAHPACL
jgi:hypothetical protein